MTLSPNNTALLQRGSTGEPVRELQTALKSAGMYLGAIDGIYGPKTASAVRQFQQMAGVAVDGIVGPETQSAIETQLGPVVPLPELPDPGRSPGPTPGLNPGPGPGGGGPGGGGGVLPGRQPPPQPDTPSQPRRGGTRPAPRQAGVSSMTAALLAAAAVALPVLYSVSD